MSDRKGKVWSIVLFVYVLCFAFRIVEYFIWRTDQTFWGEAFVHKLIGIVILVFARKRCGLTCGEIWFSREKVWRNLFGGLIFGLLVFVPAYLAEIAILTVQGRFEALDLYVSAYTVNGSIGNQTALIFFVICLIGNMINVVMEEGIFRGLFQKLLESKYSFIAAAAISACLFGLWHIMGPVRSYCDGDMSRNGFIANAILLITTSGLVGFKFAMMTKLTNSLYMAMGHHFINNLAVNILHVLSNTAADEFMVVRISIAQTISFLIILLWYILTLRPCRKQSPCADGNLQ